MRVLFGFLVLLLVRFLRPAESLRPLRERVSAAGSWNDERLFLRRDDNDLNLYSQWNITGTYRGRWSFAKTSNVSSRFLDFGRSNGVSMLELVSTPTKITGVHYVQGAVIFHDVFDKGRDLGAAQMRVEGVYIWPFKQLRMVASSGTGGEQLQEEDILLSSPYHLHAQQLDRYGPSDQLSNFSASGFLLGVFSSQVFQESSRDKLRRRKNPFTYDMEKHCNIEISAQVSRILSQNDGEHEQYHLEGMMESPSADDDGDCFSTILLNGTSLNIEVYYNKAVNYTLMITFGAAKVSILMIGHQAIMDAYLCLLHLTAGVLVESLFNAFATAAFFKVVVFSIFEMRYLLAIWKVNRPISNGEGWEVMRRELSVLYSRFYGILLAGILVMYELHNFLRPILFIMYSFWIPQIITNVIRDTRKPLHPHYILGMTLTRLAIPLYIFGCPSNFMRIEVDRNWCISVVVFLGLQASILLLQHHLGSRWFIPRQILPEKYSYYRRLDSDAAQATDCVICMTAIDVTQLSNDYMVTPCEHFFHSGCLQRWMDIKMECPTCRRALPSA